MLPPITLLICNAPLNVTIAVVFGIDRALISVAIVVILYGDVFTVTVNPLRTNVFHGTNVADVFVPIMKLYKGMSIHVGNEFGVFTKRTNCGSILVSVCVI